MGRWQDRSEAQRKRRRGILSRLARDQRGTTLAMMGMAMVPIAGMIGSGLDMSRAYLTKARLQNACDAAVLATRRVMGTQIMTEAHREEGRRFFNFNFPPGTMSADPVVLTIEPDATDPSIVVINASTAVPTSLMRIFGKDKIEMAATCNADQDIVHNDVMLVLDVTGSMNCPIGSGRLGCTSEESGARIAALRGAAQKLYLALQENDPDIITRFGFMPYSMTTNVGRDLRLNWVRNPATYHIINDGSYTTTSSTKSNTWLNDTWRSSTNLGRGCVEERSSFARITNSDITIETTIAQQDIDTVSETNANWKWAPYDWATTYTSSGLEACPAPAGKLAEYATVNDFQTRLNTAISIRGGQTHHDVGMVWGLRYLSPTGMFSADNPTMRGTKPVHKHIVFLSDGQMKVDGVFYSHIGIPDRRRRVLGLGTHEDRAKARFLSACNRAREMGVTVWVIALDIGSTDANLRNCASDATRYFEAETPEALGNAFDAIGNAINRLRLTQ